MSIHEHANVDSTRPRMRYQDDHQYYHFDKVNGKDLIVQCNADTNHLNNIPSLGISAGLIYVNGVPITNNGVIHVPASHVEHRPTDCQRGVIKISSEHPL